MTRGLNFYLFSLSFLAAVWLSHQQSTISWTAFSVILLVAMVTLLLLWQSRQRCWPDPIKAALIMLWAGCISYCLTSGQILLRLNEQLPADEENRIFRLQIEIQSLPEVRERSVQYVARVIAARPDNVPKTILV